MDGGGDGTFHVPGDTTASWQKIGSLAAETGQNHTAMGYRNS